MREDVKLIAKLCPSLIPVHLVPVRTALLWDGLRICDVVWKAPTHPILRLFDRWRGRFYNLDAEAILVLDTTAHRIKLKISMISHFVSGLGLLDTWITENDEVVGY